MKANNKQPPVPRILAALKPYNFPGPERYTEQGIYEAAARVIVERRKGRTEASKENRVRARSLSNYDAEDGSKRTGTPCEYCASLQGDVHGKDCPLAAAGKRDAKLLRASKYESSRHYHIFRGMLRGKNVYSLDATARMKKLIKASSKPVKVHSRNHKPAQLAYRCYMKKEKQSLLLNTYA